MIVASYSRPFLPLFLHVLGAMTLVGAVLAVAILALAARRNPAPPILARSSFWTLLVVAIPSWLVTLAAGHWILSDEGVSASTTWVKLGSNILEPGVLVLLLMTGAAFWWMRSGKAVAGRIVAGLSCVYLVLLAIAWLAMSGKWGSG